jgi:hypothetical protein
MAAGQRDHRLGTCHAHILLHANVAALLTLLMLRLLRVAVVEVQVLLLITQRVRVAVVAAVHLPLHGACPAAAAAAADHGNSAAPGYASLATTLSTTTGAACDSTGAHV